MQSNHSNWDLCRRPMVMLAVGAILIAPRAVAQNDFLTWSDSQKEEFLSHADVVSRQELAEGFTNSLKLTLSDGTSTHDAHFQSVDIRKPVHRTSAGLEVNFADSYLFNIAAYRVDRLLDLHMVPVSVKRRIDGADGAVTWWVDQVLMMEKERYLKKIPPPDVKAWNEQMYRVRVFNELVYNTDPNLGNLLVTTQWDLRMIDFTRAFRPFKQLRKGKNLGMFDRRLHRALVDLDPAEVSATLGDVLTESEIDALMARRDLILRFVDKQLQKLGEAKVFY